MLTSLKANYLALRYVRNHKRLLKTILRDIEYDAKRGNLQTHWKIPHAMMTTQITELATALRNLGFDVRKDYFADNYLTMIWKYD